MSDPFPAPWLGDGGLIAVRDLRFPGTGRITNAAEELSEAAVAFDQPAIFAVRAGRIAGTADTSNLGRAFGMAWQGRSAGRASGQQISAVLDMLAAIPDAAILPGYAQQTPAAFAADMGLGFGSGGSRNPIGRVFAKFGDEGCLFLFLREGKIIDEAGDRGRRRPCGAR